MTNTLTSIKSITLINNFNLINVLTIKQRDFNLINVLTIKQRKIIEETISFAIQYYHSSIIKMGHPC